MGRATVREGEVRRAVAALSTYVAARQESLREREARIGAKAARGLLSFTTYPSRPGGDHGTSVRRGAAVKAAR